VTQIVAAAARRAGLGLIHAHRLRHTAATQMLRAGATLPEIGQVLRHRRAMTTAISDILISKESDLAPQTSE